MNQTEWNVVIGILIPVGIAIATVWKQRRDLHKSLKYDYAATKVMEHTGGIVGSLVLTFSGQPVSNVSIVSIYLRNAGRQPITQADFDQGLRFEVEADRMLSVNSGQCKPSELPLTIRFNVVDKSIALDPLLLNPGDYIALSALVTGFERLSVTGRIVGVAEIEREVPRKGLPGPSIYAFASGLMVAYLIYIVASSIANPELLRQPATWIGLLVASGLLIFINR